MGTDHARAGQGRLWIAAPALVAIGMVALYAALRSPVPPIARAVAPPPAASITNAPSLPDPSPRTGSDGPAPTQVTRPASQVEDEPARQREVLGSLTPPAPSASSSANDPLADEVSWPSHHNNSTSFFAVPTAGDIESVSFTDGMTYPAPGLGQVEVHDGRGVVVNPDTGERAEVFVSEPLLHDLDRDGRPEAVLEVTVVRPQGPQTSTIWVLAVEAGHVVTRGSIGGSATPVGFDRPTELVAEGRVLSVTNWTGGYDPAGSVSTQTIHYELLDGLETVDRSPTRSWTRVGVQPDHELRLLGDSPYAYLELDRSRPDQRFRYSGRGGEVVRASAVEGSGVRLRAWHEGERWTYVGDVDAGAELTLPFDGGYLFEAIYHPTATENAVLDVAVAQRRRLDAPILEPVTTGRVDLDGIQTSLRFPAIAQAAPHIDGVAVNALIERFALDLRDRFVAEHRAECGATDQPVVAISYQTRLQSYDLVSIAFDAYRSGCTGGSGYASAGLTIDLNTGKAIRLADLADGGSAALSRALLAGVERQGFSSGDASLGAEPVVMGFTLTPEFVRVEVDVSDFGHEYPLSVWLALDEPPFSSGLAQRAASGFAGPVSGEGCGCY